ncbi:ketoacyl-synt-domain-containing protein [Aspergillus sclerotioniger CBS 115572]|uniref:Ketoacyl-synt-domain-containing protein n=1 Tax=Aspergillus sclerotioniger CBS 115572 TaxID=1450535 RepID=A0A317X3K0_9EURO|nr:ketoacyl-synt-domain-containing protein [Aspergillus sclerotioniger CBS 115572]PWY93214.1 ketoacyl-synt-domain-containing protein [Aspergillus sclerotioniger CBS 115572]
MKILTVGGNIGTPTDRASFFCTRGGRGLAGTAYGLTEVQYSSSKPSLSCYRYHDAEHPVRRSSPESPPLRRVRPTPLSSRKDGMDLKVSAPNEHQPIDAKVSTTQDLVEQISRDISMDARRIIFFGGQGSRAFSGSPFHPSEDDKTCDSSISLLLSVCHSAILQEALQHRRRGPLPAWADFDLPANAELLVSGNVIASDNAILQGVGLCVHQLVAYLRFDSTLQKRATSILLGFCSGIVPAVVLACSSTVQDYIQYSKDAVRLAYWIGYRAAELTAHLMPEQNPPGSWALSVFGKGRENLKTDLERFNVAHGATFSLRLAICFGKESFTIVGPPSSLNRFRSQCLGEQHPSEAIHIHALYHAGETGCEGLLKVLEDARREGIQFPSLADIKTALWTCHGNSSLDRNSFSGSGSLLEYAVRLILVDAADLYNTWKLITDTINHLPWDGEIITVGPGSSALLVSTTRDTRTPDEPTWINLSGVGATVGSAQDGFAIVGMSVNYPGASGKDEFWTLLENGLSAMQEIPSSRFEVQNYSSDSPECRPPRTMEARHGNFLADPFSFDHECFGISPREAKSMDPQQKLLLQGAVHALDDAGYVPNGAPSFNPDTMGCYIGAATEDYVINSMPHIDVYYSTGTLRAFLSGKISYANGWSGPSITTDTACSSSLVSIVLACRALMQGDCTAALAGGVNAITSPDMYLGLSRAHFLSATGQCKPFSVAADGYCRAEGCGLFVIKRLQDAIQEGDRIHGIIRGAEMNQSGRASSITHPHALTQQELFQKLLARTKVDPKTIGVIEAHGTGTQAGDAVETSSIHCVFGNRANPLYLTSVKGNIGHAEAASGSAGLAKILMMLRYSKIPPQVGLGVLNPRLDKLESSNIRIPTTICDWDRAIPSMPKRALLNNFGAAGSNAALVVEEYRPSFRAKGSQYARRAAYNLILCATSPGALQKLISLYVAMLEKHDPGFELQDICFTATARRQRHKYALSIVGGTLEDLMQQLQQARQCNNQILESNRKRPIVFVFSGQGGAYPGMGRELLHTAPVFRQKVTECEGVLQEIGLSNICPTRILDGAFIPSETEDGGAEWLVNSQVACFVLEYALASLLISWNIQPDIVIGHSLGEYAALVVARALSLEDALRVVAHRAKLMASKCEVGKSTMLACCQSAFVTQVIIQRSGLSHLSIACDNDMMSCVVAGPIHEIERLQEIMGAEQIRCKRLPVSLGFHSPALDPIIDELNQVTRDIRFFEPQIPIGSGLYGELHKSPIDGSYVGRQTREPVNFTGLVGFLAGIEDLQRATFIEVGPTPITLPMVRSQVSGPGTAFFNTLVKGQDAWSSLCHSLRDFNARHESVQWRHVFHGSSAKVVDLPDYPFQTQSLFFPFHERVSQVQADANSGHGVGQPRPSVFRLLQEVISLPAGPDKSLSVFGTTSRDLVEYITGHEVAGLSLCPASIYYGMVLEGLYCNREVDAQRLAVFRDISFDHPLIHASNSDISSIHLTLKDKKSDAGTTSSHTQFTFSSATSSESAAERVLCSGQTAWMSLSAISSILGRRAAYARKQIALLRGSQSRSNVLHRKVIYDIIFARVVRYSDPYQSIQDFHVSEAGLDGYGTFQVPQSTLVGGIISPVFLDTLLHAAGFIANAQGSPSDAYICHSVDSVIVAYSDIKPTDTYRFYCGLLDCGGGELLGETVAMSSDGKAVASVEGMHFKRLNLKAFTAHLSRQSGQKAQIVLPGNASSSSANPKAGHTSSSMDKTPDTTKIVLDAVSTVCAVPPSQVGLATRLVDLGFDSLMQVELWDLVGKPFPSRRIRLSFEMGTVEDIVSQVLGARNTSSVASSPRSESDECSPSNSICASITDRCGKLIPDGDAVTDRVLGLVAEICGRRGSDLDAAITMDSLGLDSLLTIELQASVRDVFGISLPLEMLSPRTTIGMLATRIAVETRPVTPVASSVASDRQAWMPEHDWIVLLQQGADTLPPLILVHDGSGTVEQYRRLSVVGCTVFGIRNPMPTGSVHWASGLMDMACRYAAAIPNVIKSRRVVLGGWSFGGVLAHEIAQRLDQCGYDTLGVLLIDSPCPLDHEPLPSAVVDHILSAETLSPSTKIALAAQFKCHAQFLADYSITGSPPPPHRRYIMLYSEQNFDTWSVCGQRYLWLESQEERLASLRKWEALLGRQLTTYNIPGNHFEPFSHDNVGTMTKALRTAYRETAGVAAT